MTWTLNETFDAPDGQWDDYAPWDATEASESVKGFLTTQKHVDLRCFRNWGLVDPAPQYPNMDVPPQTTLDAETQTKMELELAVNDPQENWLLSGSGLNSMTYGVIAARGGWAGLQATTQAGAIDATVTSSITRTIDISPGTDLSIILPDYNSWDGDSYVQMSSDPAGLFGTGHDSAQVAFSANEAVMPHLKLAIASFAQSGFDHTKVTGVRIRLHKAAGAGSGHTVTLMAIRSLDPAWVVSWLDFDTDIGSVVRPVTLDGNTTTGTVAQAFQFIRGDGTRNDPIPADLAMSMFFYPGGSTSPNDATGSTYNYVALMMRENKAIGSTGSHIEAGLQFNDAATNFLVKYVSTTGGSPGTPTITGSHTVSLGTVLDPTQRYLFYVNLTGTKISTQVWTVKTDHTPISMIWSTEISDPAYIYRNGRVGFIGDLRSRDAYVEAILATPTGFAEFQTVTYTSRTPVDGAQLAGVYSPDVNLFTSIAGVDMVVDPSKTYQGADTYRATQAMVTNTFQIEDWTQTYLDLAIWVSNSVTVKNQPQIWLNLPGIATLPLLMPILKASQWNVLHFDLGVFRNLLTGTVPGPTISIQPGSNPDKDLGLYWVSEPTIGRRRVSWFVRATDSGAWRSFKSMVNNSSGAVHFTPEERGSSLQLKATALTEDAWVASFHLFPRYASLGRPLYIEIPSFWARFSGTGDAYADISEVAPSATNINPEWYQTKIWIPSGSLNALDNASASTSAMLFGIFGVGAFGFGPPDLSSVEDQIYLIKSGDHWNWYSNVAGDSGVEATPDTVHTFKYKINDGITTTVELFIDGVSIFGGSYTVPSGADEGFVIGAINPAASREVYYFGDAKVGSTDGGGDVFEDTFSSLSFNPSWDVAGDATIVMFPPL